LRLCGSQFGIDLRGGLTDAIKDPRSEETRAPPAPSPPDCPRS
jgi:hypothetical protein